MALGETASSLTGYLGKATSLGREIHTRKGVAIQNIEHFMGSGANDIQQGSDVGCGELLVMGHPDNGGTVWVRTGETATVNNAWPLAAGEVFSFNVDNLSKLQMLIVVDGDDLIVAYA